MTRLVVRTEAWSIRGQFSIARGSKVTANVVVVELRDADGHCGRGECVPYGRYGESLESVVAQIENLREPIVTGLDQEALQRALPAGAARNAVDCALWDLEAKQTGKRVWELLRLDAPQPLTTAFTLSMDTPTKMADAARAQANRPALKLKLSGTEDIERVAAVRTAAPDAVLIVDANEGWTIERYRKLAPQLRDLGVAVIEQPLPSGSDDALANTERLVAVCADESCHDVSTLAGLAGKYDMINIKLDKTGGLTEALRLREAAVAAGYRIMVGCMVSTSLSIAPAILVAQDAEVVDLDGPLLLEEDRDCGLHYEGSLVHLASSSLWG